jgi:hypothetical protein
MTRHPPPGHRAARGTRGPRTAISALLAVLAIAGGAALGGFVVDRIPLRTPEAAVATPAPTATLPSEDVAGDSIAGLPRYPGSVRTAYLQERQGETAVVAAEYVTGAELDDVRAFYRRAFREHDWELVELDFATGEWIFLIQRGARVALVEIEDHGHRTVIEVEAEEPVRSGDSKASATPRPTPTPQPPPPAQSAPPDDDDDDDGWDD